MGKKRKKKDQPISIEMIKQLGIKSEKHLNQFIHKWLDDPEIVKLINNGCKQHVRLLKLIREYVDIVALHLNIPTKDDVANVAKIAIQVEEKLDCLEDKILAVVDDKLKHNKKRKKRRIGKNHLREQLLHSIISHSPDDLTKYLLEQLKERKR